MNLVEEINNAKIDTFGFSGGSLSDFEDAVIEIARKYAREMCVKQKKNCLTNLIHYSRGGNMQVRSFTESLITEPCVNSMFDLKKAIMNSPLATEEEQ